MDIIAKNISVHLPSDGSWLFHIPIFAIPFGSKILIQGPSGKGKTTLLHLLAGIFLPTRGEVTLGTHHLATLSDDERCRLRRQHLALVFQKLNLLGQLTTIENIILGCNAPARRQMIENVLENLGILNLAHRLVASLSLGEQQRVAMARVVISQPKIILADEPTSSLDDVNADLVINALNEAARDKTIVVVSHDRRLRDHFDTVVNFMDLISPGSGQ